jgi:hypothetical protein
MAVKCVLRVTSLKPYKYTARAAIELELQKIPGFTTYGRNKYLHLGSYQALMREVAKRTDRIKVDPSGYGVAVRYVPQEE